MRREYKLAAEPERWADGLLRRAILETGGGSRETILVVADSDAVDVLEAIRRAYQDGREDRAEEDERRRYSEPPLLTSLDSEDWNGPEPEPDVSMVCTECRKPVERTFDDEWQHQGLDDGLACSARNWGPVRAMVAEGNEKIPQGAGKVSSEGEGTSTSLFDADRAAARKRDNFPADAWDEAEDDFVADRHYDAAAAWAAGDDEAPRYCYRCGEQAECLSTRNMCNECEQETAQAEGLAAADLDPGWPGHGDER